MKILSIRIKNLASLEGLTEIDFTQEPLCSAGIFAITGATGSGKSTILDALCLALYGQTPRYTQAKESGIALHDVQGSTINQNDVRGILRDGTADGFAEVTFIGVDGNNYCATWSVKRAHNKITGSLQSASITLKNSSTGVDVPGKKTELQPEIERLVGLNFEQFTRSVLLAQGDFSAFLKANKDGKSALLEKLTGTEIYSKISKRIHEKHKDEAQELKDLNLQREGIPTLTAEETTDFETQENALEISIAEYAKGVDDLGKEIEWHKQLEKLQDALTTAVAAREQASEAKKQVAGRELKLSQVEKVQPARVWVEGIQNSTDQLSSKMISKDAFETARVVLGKEKDASEEALQHANEKLTAVINTQEQAQPLIEEARTLDVQLKEKEEQVRKATENVISIQEKYTKQQEQVKNKTEEAEALQKNIDQLTQWKAENISRQAVSDNQNLIVSKLSDAQNALSAIQKAASSSLEVEEKIGTKKREKSALDTQHVDITEQITTLQQAFDIISSEVSVIPIAALESDKSEADNIVEDLVRAEVHWKNVFAAQTELNTLKQTHTTTAHDLVEKKEAFEEAVQQLTNSTLQRDISGSMLNRARIAAAENVETLRLQLEPGHPCPVCGSEHHPYVDHNSQLDRVLAELEDGHATNEKAYTRSVQLHSGLQQQCDQLQRLIVEQEKTIASKDVALQELERVWSGFAVYSTCVSIPDQQKEAWLKQEVQTKKTLQQDLHQQIQAFYKRRRELDAAKSALDGQKEKLAQVTNAIKDGERHLQSLQDQLDQYGREQHTSNDILVEIEKSLSHYFTAQDWFQNWKLNPGDFVARINHFSEQWKMQTKELEEKSGKHSVLTATIFSEQKLTEQLSQEVQKQRTILDELSGLYDALVQKRKTFFNGEDIALVEAGHKQAIERVRQQLDTCKDTKEKIEQDRIRTHTQLEAIEKEIVHLNEQVAALIAKCAEWLNLYASQEGTPLTETELKELLTFSLEWVDSERKAIRAIDDALTQAQSILKERSSTLEKHKHVRVSEKTVDALNTLLIETKGALQTDSQLKHEIGVRLRDDATNKQRIGSLLQTIEAKALIVENWAKLNEMIGSADGKKFREIAQEYTLDVLLSYANVHLEMLSKRYLLQRIPDTLALQVLDQDMGDEIRTIYSLSGGESFLVSLALALGLASLSSSRMNVESLFIDEGFGSLDPVTLNIAMDALERLHNQGRKVGVISHVQEMTERIPVQIKVSKQQSGKSVVEVMG
jgi:exonuclease SbcC